MPTPRPFDQHALGVIEDRKMDVASVLRTVEAPDWSADDPYRGGREFSDSSRVWKPDASCWTKTRTDTLSASGCRVLGLGFPQNFCAKPPDIVEPRQQTGVAPNS
jgi:hypothetical protein